MIYTPTLGGYYIMQKQYNNLAKESGHGLHGRHRVNESYDKIVRGERVPLGYQNILVIPETKCIYWISDFTSHEVILLHFPNIKSYMIGRYNFKEDKIEIEKGWCGG